MGASRRQTTSRARSRFATAPTVMGPNLLAFERASLCHLERAVQADLHSPRPRPAHSVLRVRGAQLANAASAAAVVALAVALAAPLRRFLRWYFSAFSSRSSSLRATWCVVTIWIRRKPWQRCSRTRSCPWWRN